MHSATAPSLLETLQSVRVGPSVSSVSLEAPIDGAHDEPHRSDRRVHLSLHRDLRLRVRLPAAVVQSVLNKVANDLAAKPVMEDKHYSLSLTNVRIPLLRGGFALSCAFAVRAFSRVTKALGVDPHLRGDIFFPVSPVFIRDGAVFVSVPPPTLAPPAECSQVTQDAFTWLKQQVKLEARVQAAVQQALSAYNGRNIVTLAQEAAPSQGTLLKRATHVVDANSAQGAIVEDEQGQLVLDVSLAPTRNARIAVYAAGALCVCALVAALIVAFT